MKSPAKKKAQARSGKKVRKVQGKRPGKKAAQRRWRAERRWVEELKAQLEPLPASGRHPSAEATPRMVRTIREEMGLSIRGFARLCGHV